MEVDSVGSVFAPKDNRRYCCQVDQEPTSNVLQCSAALLAVSTAADSEEASCSGGSFVVYKPADPLTDLLITVSTETELKNAVVDAAWNRLLVLDESWLKAIDRLPFSFKKSLDAEMNHRMRDLHASMRISGGGYGGEAAQNWWGNRRMIIRDFSDNYPTVMTAHLQSMIPKFDGSSPTSEKSMHKTMVRVIKAMNLTHQQRDVIKTAWFEYYETVLRLKAGISSSEKHCVSNMIAFSKQKIASRPINTSESAAVDVEWLVARAYTRLHRSVTDGLEWQQWVQLLFSSLPFLPDCRMVAIIVCGLCTCDLCLAEKNNLVQQWRHWCSTAAVAAASLKHDDDPTDSKQL